MTLVVIAMAACATLGFDRPPSIAVAEPTDDGVQILRARVDSYYFEPSRLVVKVNVPVRLVLDSGTLTKGHSFSLFSPEAAIEVNAYVPARQRVTVEFLPRAEGKFPFHCNLDDHVDKGMTGVLEVVAELPGKTRGNSLF